VASRLKKKSELYFTFAHRKFLTETTLWQVRFLQAKRFSEREKIVRRTEGARIFHDIVVPLRDSKMFAKPLFCPKVGTSRE